MLKIGKKYQIDVNGNVDDFLLVEETKDKIHGLIFPDNFTNGFIMHLFDIKHQINFNNDDDLEFIISYLKFDNKIFTFGGDEVRILN